MNITMGSPKIRRFPTSNTTAVRFGSPAWKRRLKDNHPYDIIGITYCFIGCWGWAALQYGGMVGPVTKEGDGGEISSDSVAILNWFLFLPYENLHQVSGIFKDPQ